MHTIDDTLAETLARHHELVRREIEAVLGAHEPHEPREPRGADEGSDQYYGIMRYHLGLASADLKPMAAPVGKGLRGALLLLVARAFDGDARDVAPLAAAVELLHNFSLVHDDIEDGSATRRHRATVWSIWGAPIGINAGDGLYALAHLALYRSPLRDSNSRALIDVARTFEEAALHLAEGQHRDMTLQAAGVSDVSVDDYLRMIDGKTATLIAAAASIGARAAGAGATQVGRAGRFGRELGLAFQMQDDILGIWGDERVTGKSAVSDIATRKKTLPVLLALAHAAPDDRARLRALYARPGDSAADAADTADILALLDRAGARDVARDYLRRHREAALQVLAEMDLPDAASAPLRAFERRFAERTA
jgi:geranylgeranyl diphosphate synthase type I